MAVYIIDIGGGASEESSFGEVVVIRDGELRPEDDGRPDAVDTGPRPEMDIPRPEPTLQIITPTPAEELPPLPVVIPDFDDVPAGKTPPEPYLN